MIEGPQGCAPEALITRAKRRAYLVLLAVSIPVLVAVVAVELPEDPFVARTYPFLVGVLALVLVAHVARWISLQLVEVAIFVVAGGAVVLRLANLLLVGQAPLAERMMSLVGAHYWSYAVLLVLCFLLFERRRGLIVASILWVASALLTVIALVREAAAGQLIATDVVNLGRVHAFLAAIVALVAGAAALREQLDRALERAEVLGERAVTDPLTGLANRYAGNDRLSAETADARRRERPLTVVLFDLDHFKRINDVHGHGVGDDVLVAVAEAVRSTIRPRDLLVRWGGEEFLAILPETTLAEGLTIADRARTALGEVRPHGLVCTATFGVAEHADEERVADLLRRADAALYVGKANGRDRIVAAELPLRS